MHRGSPQYYILDFGVCHGELFLLFLCWTCFLLDSSYKVLFSILAEHNFIIERIQEETRKVR